MGERSTPCPYCEKPVNILFLTCPHCSRQARTSAPALTYGSIENAKFLQWARRPSMSPPWVRYPACTVNDANEVIEFLEFNPGWTAISGGELERKFDLGHDKPALVAQRAKEAGHVESVFMAGKTLYVKLRDKTGHSGR
jgi:hypothetical protein